MEIMRKARLFRVSEIDIKSSRGCIDSVGTKVRTMINISSLQSRMRVLGLISGRHVLSVVGVFMLWTLTSCLCHGFAKMFLNISRKMFVSTDDPNASLCRLYIAVIITVIQVMNVLSHSVANIFKRLLVVLLLCVAGNRHVTALNFTGLCMSLCGLLVYTQGKRGPETQTKGQDHHTARVGAGATRGKLFLFVGLLALAAVSAIGSTWHTQVFGVHQQPSDTKHDIERREDHNYEGYQDILAQFSHVEEEETDPRMRKFLRRRLLELPEDTDMRAKTLTNSTQIVEEAQRILVNLLLDLLGKAKHVMLIEIPTYENKGDAAIAVGEMMLLRRLNVSVVFYCSTDSCTRNTSLQEALEVNKQYPKNELVLLLQGGGNLVGYPDFDKIREQFITRFPDRRIIMFS